MPEHPLRRLLSKILHEPNPANIEVGYVHRGAPEDRLVINASEIARVSKGSFLRADRETQIPFHRILFVRDSKKNVILWQKKPRAESSDRAP